VNPSVEGTLFPAKKTRLDRKTDPSPIKQLHLFRVTLKCPHPPHEFLSSPIMVYGGGTA